MVGAPFFVRAADEVGIEVARIVGYLRELDALGYVGDFHLG